MTTEQFERAINSSGGYIKIDEMMLHGSGQVHQVLGHTERCFIVWDENGRGFSADRESARERFVVVDDDGCRLEDGLTLVRDDVFDLVFE